eukprot:4637092-Lingulodinium_polyedra.AAC.1
MLSGVERSPFPEFIRGSATAHNALGATAIFPDAGAPHRGRLKTLDAAAVPGIVLFRQTAAGVAEGTGLAHLG